MPDREVAAVMQQGVDQGAGLAAGRRMDRHAGRLVDDDQVGVLVEHGQGDRFRLRDGGHDGGQGDGVEAGLGLARGDRHRRAVAGDHAFGQQGLQARTRQGREDVGQGLVEPDAALLQARLKDGGAILIGEKVFGQQGFVGQGAAPPLDRAVADLARRTE